MNRTERYERGLSMMNRIFELETNHGWSELETRTAFAALDEQLPIGLHNVGELSTMFFLYHNYNIYIPI
jgi:acyl-CoA oxidase